MSININLLSLSDLNKAGGYIRRKSENMRVYGNFINMFRSKGTSIYKKARKNILQYPILITSAIDDIAYTTTIAKCMEREFANLLLLALQDQPLVDYDVHKSVSSILKQYHQNKDIDAESLLSDTLTIASLLERINSAKTSATESLEYDDQIPIDERMVMRVTEAVFVDDPSIDIASLDAVISLYEDPELLTVTENLNTIYMPYESTMEKLEKIVMESNNKSDKKISAGEIIISMADNTSTLRKNMHSTNRGADIDDVYGLGVKSSKSRTTVGKNGDSETEKFIKNMSAQKRSSPKVLNPRDSGLKGPTIMSVQFSFELGEGRVFTTPPINIGILASIAILQSTELKAETVKHFNGSNKAMIFKDWTQGKLELFKKLIFNLDKVSDTVINKNTAGMWFGMLKRRKNRHSFSKNTNPIATIVYTSTEVEDIRLLCGKNLADADTARKFLSKLFILCIVIVDMSTGSVKTLFDGADMFEETDIQSMFKQLNRENASVTDAKIQKQLVGGR